MLILAFSNFQINKFSNYADAATFLDLAFTFLTLLEKVLAGLNAGMLCAGTTIVVFLEIIRPNF